MRIIAHSHKSKAAKSLAAKAREKRRNKARKLYKGNKPMGYNESRDAVHMRKLLTQ